MRWIQHDKDKIKRNDSSPPDGDLHFVDEKSSMAIVDGVLYINGKKASQGKHNITLKNHDLELDIDKKGKVKGKKVNRRGKGS